jgi:hypothetical protein
MLRAATDEFLTASLVGDGFESALAQLADGAGTSGAVLSLDDGLTAKGTIHTSEVAEAVTAWLSGGGPPNPRTIRCVPSLREGFRADQDDFSQEELARSPWYQEFLRPRGFFWNATATLLKGASGEGLYVSFKRRVREAPFERGEIAAFSELLPDLRRAASLGRRMREFETLGMAKLIHERGDPVFELDIWGRVLRIHAFDDRQPSPSLSVIQRRLVAGERLAQLGLDRALHRALAPAAANGITCSSSPSSDGRATCFSQRRLSRF